MANNYDTVKGVDWREVFPWTTLTRAFSVAVSIPVLLLAAIGVGFTVSGWNLAEELLVAPNPAMARVGATSEDTGAVDPEGEGQSFAVNEGLQSAPDDPLEFGEQPAEKGVQVHPSNMVEVDLGLLPDEQSVSVLERLLAGEGLTLIGEIHDSLFDRHRQSDTKTGYALCIVDFVWLLLVWGVFGATITRIAVMRIGRGEKIGVKEAATDVCKKYVSYVMSPLFVLVSCFVLSLPIVLVSLLLNFDIGVVLASLLWILVIVAGIGVAVLLIGLFFGWPLMWPTISAEEAGDVYEATSRSFAYTFQAPVQYLFYVLVSMAIWVPSVILVQNFASLAETVIFSGMNVAADEGQVIQDFIAGKTTLDGQSQVFVVGASIISGLHWFGHLMADAFCVGFFFASFSGVYLLLRRYVDHTPMDEVFVIDDKTKYGLDDLIQQTTEQSAE